MKTLVMINGDAVLPDGILKDAAVVCSGGKIRAICPRRKVKIPAKAELIDARRGYISPGYVDIHVHGGGGADFMDGTTDAVQTVNRTHARHGVTTIIPTTTTGSPEQVQRMLRCVIDVRDNWTSSDGARIGGVHFYGPYFAEDKIGCHSPGGRRDPDTREYMAAFDMGIIRVATCAAELPGAIEFYREARKRKYFITCGHSNSDWAEMDAAFKVGMRHVDHFWCVMSSVASLRPRFGTPMRASMEQFVLANPEMSTEVIADGHHLSNELLAFAYQMKGSKRLCLVSDSSRAVDLPPGDYRFGPDTDGAWFHSDGQVGRTMPGTPPSLASSIVALDHMVRIMHKATKAPLHEVIRMATLTPAERTGMHRQVGSLDRGKRADLLVLDRALQVKRVFIGGEELSAMA